jgi:hypothetical protein
MTQINADKKKEISLILNPTAFDPIQKIGANYRILHVVCVLHGFAKHPRRGQW